MSDDYSITGSLRKLTELDQEAAEQILLAYESGIPPPDRYLPWLLEGVYDIVDDLIKEINDLRNGVKGLSVIFITGERGGGKTTLARGLKTIFQSATKGYTVPVFMDFALHRNAVSFIKNLFFKMLYGAFQIPETENEDQERLIESAVNFSVQLNAFLLNPRLLQDLPQGYVKDQAKYIADCDGILYLILDEVDRLTQLDPDAADSIFFILKNVQEVRNLKKIYLFCTTKESKDWLKSAHHYENPFLSRIFSNPSVERDYVLSYSSDSLENLIKKVTVVFEKAKGINIPSHFQEVIKRIPSYEKTPRRVIGRTITLLHDYSNIKPVIDEKISSSGGFFSRRSSIDIGNTLDRHLKTRILPLLPKIYQNVLFSMPPTVQSVWSINESRKADGQITFPDDYKIVVEIKYTERYAQLKRDQLDQVVSYFFDKNLNKDKLEGWFFLFGNFDSNCLSKEDESWINAKGLTDKIKFFFFKDDMVLKDLAIVMENANDPERLKACLNWLLMIGNAHKNLINLANKHFVEIKVPKKKKDLTQFLGKGDTTKIPAISNKKPVLVSTTNYSSAPSIDSSNNKISVRKTPLTEVNGIGQTIAQRIEDELGITSVEELVKYSEYELSKVKRLSVKRAKQFLDAARKLLGIS